MAVELTVPMVFASQRDVLHDPGRSIRRALALVCRGVQARGHCAAAAVPA
jgi:hypothetical protein